VQARTLFDPEEQVETLATALHVQHDRIARLQAGSENRDALAFIRRAGG
jgi:hypothetical protein